MNVKVLSLDMQVNITVGDEFRAQLPALSFPGYTGIPVLSQSTGLHLPGICANCFGLLKKTRIHCQL